MAGAAIGFPIRQAPAPIVPARPQRTLGDVVLPNGSQAWAEVNPGGWSHRVVGSRNANCYGLTREPTGFDLKLLNSDDPLLPK